MAEKPEIKKPGRRHRRKKARKPSAQQPVKHYSLLCFDSETTNHGELLELSVFDNEGNEVFHHYFRPSAKTWPTDIHHISPEMVAGCKRFIHYRNELQQLLNSTDCFVGCALSNDLHTLRRYGVKLNNHHVFDIQNLYWLLNDETQRLEKQQKGLSAIADHYRLGFGNEQPHSATADTRLTLECFKAMLDDFSQKFQTEQLSFETEESVEKIRKYYNLYYQRAMQEHRMRNICGVINVVRRDPGAYSFKSSRYELTDNDRIVLSIPVNDRVRAEKDLRNHFSPKQIKGYTGIYRLKDEDFEYIRNYTNSIDLETFIKFEEETEKEKKAARSKAIKSITPKTSETSRRKKPHKRRAQKKPVEREAKRALRNATK